MSEPLRRSAAVTLLLLAVGCQSTSPERAALVEQCRQQGHMLGETALETCVQQLAERQGESFGDRTGSCVVNCNR